MNHYFPKSRHERCNWKRKTLIRAVLLMLSVASFSVLAQWHSSPNAVKSTLHYWKRFAIDPVDDVRVAQAQRIFQRLLRVWQSPRIPPALYIVGGQDAVWAASLNDGTILLTEHALKVALSPVNPNAASQLAFVLAHELAHQQADHLWEQRFFRSLEPERIQNSEPFQTAPAFLEEKERQADTDGLVLMTLVGFDPLAIVGDDDFFSYWVEGVQGRTCPEREDARLAQSACQKAKHRAKRSRQSLLQITNQAILFKLGVQSYVAGNYVQSIRYLEAFGRLFPNYTVHSNLGLAHVAQALLLARKQGENREFATKLKYPLLLSTSTLPLRKKTFRGLQSIESDTARQQEINIHINTAITAFDNALVLAPEKPQAYYHLISAHLLAGNFSLASGVLIDKYLKKFEQSPQSALLAALTTALEGYGEEAIKQLYQIVEYINNDVLLSTEERRLLLYTTYYNLAILHVMAGNKDHAIADWIRLKEWANGQRDGLLFTLAVRHLTERGAAVLPRSPSLSTILGVKAGDDASTLKQRYETVHGFSLWLEGEKLLFLQYPEGKRLVIDENEKVKSAWQVLPISIESRQTVFDRFIKRHGIPTRYIPSDGCDYLAYDVLGVGFCVTEGSIFSKFIYTANKE